MDNRKVLTIAVRNLLSCARFGTHTLQEGVVTDELHNMKFTNSIRDLQGTIGFEIPFYRVRVLDKDSVHRLL